MKTTAQDRNTARRSTPYNATTCGSYTKAMTRGQHHDGYADASAGYAPYPPIHPPYHRAYMKGYNAAKAAK